MCNSVAEQIAQKLTPQELNDMVHELKERKKSLTSILNEAFLLKELKDRGFASKKDGDRALELQDMANDHMNWINEHAPVVKAALKPAIR